MGEKLSHSFSPQIHKYFYDNPYTLFEVESEKVEAFLKGDNFDAINVTIPYKKTVIPFCSELSETAKKVGSVNTLLKREDGTLFGDNTDYFGFQSMLERTGLVVTRKKVLVLGSGGASATASCVLREVGANVIIISRSGEITGIRANSCNGNTVTTTEKTTIPQGSVIYRNFNIAFERELEKNMPQRSIPVALHLKKDTDGSLILAAQWSRTNETEKYTCSISAGDKFEAATNLELATANLYRQLGKSSGIFSFELKSIDDGIIVPFIPASQLNELRRKMAAKIEEIIPTLWKTSAYDRSAIKVKPQVANLNLNYLANCSNKLSHQVYRDCGAEKIADAYEITPEPKAELMRTKYCIKYELGICPNHQNGGRNSAVKEPLRLINGDNSLELKFDCRNCQMLIIG